MIKNEIKHCAIYNCDCMNLIKQYADNFFDLAIVDPPYGGGTSVIISSQELLKKSPTHTGGRFDECKIERTGGTWSSKYGNKIKAWDIAPDENYFKELFRVSKYQIIWGGNYFVLPPSRNFIIWEKISLGEDFSMAMCEYAWTNLKGNAKIFKHPPQDPDRFHPTQKPVKLYKWLLTRYAQQGDKILDTHLGSGSIAVACNELGFNLTACEIDQEYFNAACNRITQAAAQKLFDF